MLLLLVVAEAMEFPTRYGTRRELIEEKQAVQAAAVVPNAARIYLSKSRQGRWVWVSMGREGGMSAEHEQAFSKWPDLCGHMTAEQEETKEGM